VHLTKGICLTQYRDGDIVVMRPGDPMSYRPASGTGTVPRPGHFMTHVAIWDGLRDGQEGPETEWGEHVADDEYNQAARV
jgi:hypothetical protein